MPQPMAERRSLVRRTRRVEQASETMAAEVREGLLRRPLLRPLRRKHTRRTL